MAESVGAHIHIAQDEASTLAESNRKKQQAQQPRQLLSCTKCRERKVKCDRTKPCSACCARGSPRDCHFIAEDGNYAPIQQSYELRKLRAENLRLKERLRAYKISADDDLDQMDSLDSPLNEGAVPSRRRAVKQKRFQTSEWQDSIYFGSPGLATVLSDFSSADASVLPLSYTIPRASDMFRSLPTYPFPTLFVAAPDECIPQLISCLPMKDELMEYFGVFQRLVCPVPVQTTKKEIEAFLSDARKKSQLYPTTLALLFGFIALGAQHSVWDKSGGRWNADAIEIETQKGNVYIAAAMQALRLSSFTHKPSLSAIQTLLMIGSYLTNNGRMLDSFALFGTTIRLAHSIGLHRHPKYLNPAPTNEKDCVIRQKVWWHMLHLDEQMSMTLGRPLGISGIGDNPWPTELTTDPVSLRFGEFVNHFTILARQIMSSNRLTNARIDEYTDILRRLLDTIPETLQFRDTWMLPETTLPDLYAVATVYFSNAHTYIVLLNQQKTEKHATSATISTGKDNVLPFQAVNHASSLDFSHETYSTQAAPRGRTLVLASSEALISAFMFFHYRDPAALIDWATAQQAFNGCMILLLDALECRTVTTGAFKAEQAFVVFKDLYENSVHELAGLAVEKLSLCLQELHRLITLPSDVQSLGQRHTAMQGAQQNEATRASAATETVMGHTGMFLLEDMSQQTAANGVFSPIVRNTSNIATQAEEHHHAGLHLGGAYKKEATSAKDNIANARYTDGMQGLRRSTTLRSASTRYATLSEDDHMQPHGYTAPTSPADFSMLRDHQLKNTIDHHGWQTSRGDESSRPLHLYTQFQKVATPGGPQNDMIWHHEWSRDVSGGIQERRPQSSAWPQRHNSCPAVPPVSAHPPILRPAFSSPDDIDRPTMEQRSLNTPITSAEHTPFNISESFSRVVETNPRTPFTPHRAAPLQMSSITEATPGFSSTVLGGFYGEQGQIRSQVVIYPSTIAASSSLTPMTENMNMNDWNRYAGSEGLD